MKINRLIILFLFYVVNAIIYSNETGVASWYGPTFHGKKTANGEIFNTYDFTAAHKTLPFGSIVKVISLENNKSTIVRINDRGPFAKNRIIDLSKAAAEQLDMISTGTMEVKTIILESGDNKYYKYTGQIYSIQIASFSTEENALQFLELLKDKFNNVEIKKVFFNKRYFRVVIQNCNYSELQLNRVKLHKEGLNNYLVVKHKKNL